ncbi:unnamed protein product [Prorocentrum cordatum]|uniref:Uncharacterized protein n=1 Tax=Prorocentrum cordatum TaxID=2364126 RepID=A0ABN9RYM2_9DINO|nr:unnamed protein product [Polarella glacialis]|mmetsp:Transcript_32604/g.85540  ORF Transcript_32604/g.85540 Transcript_32604/m.85540 type:complete len:319 (-) Transcript_32604:259-1215(-)
MQATRKSVTVMPQDIDIVATTRLLGYPGAYEPLTKHELHRLHAKQAALHPNDCEKRAALSQEHDRATAAFANARQDRANQNTDDDARGQLVKDKLAALKSKTDQEARQQNEIVKAFNQEFTTTYNQRKEAWRSTRDAFVVKFKEKCASTNQGIGELEAIIEREHEACLADTNAEISRIVEVEKERSDGFERLVADRAKQHAAFRTDLAETFADLRRRVAREAQARESQAVGTQERASADYVALDDQIGSLSARLDRDLEDIRLRLSEEVQERAAAQDRVVDDMHRFCQAIQDNLADRQRGVGDTQRLLKDLQVMLHEG